MRICSKFFVTNKCLMKVLTFEFVVTYFLFVWTILLTNLFNVTFHACSLLYSAD